jgi:hypothetical protein
MAQLFWKTNFTPLYGLNFVKYWKGGGLWRDNIVPLIAELWIFDLGEGEDCLPLLLNTADIDCLLNMKDCVEEIEKAYEDLARERAVNQPEVKCLFKMREQATRRMFLSPW